VPLLAEIPLEPSLSEAADIGRPVLVSDPGGRQARVFLELASQVAGRLNLGAE
jgi:ATP-binding protein involved in chromosome partitioning